MTEFFQRLFDTDGFVPRKDCGAWTAEHAWLHIASDLFIWLAYVSIPLVLIWFLRRWHPGPIRWVGLLFVAFILSCGFTHFLDALMFYYPAYRVAGLLKLVTALVSWATVVVLMFLAPRTLEVLERIPAPRRENPLRAEGPGWNYGIALAAVILALLLRGLMDPLLGNQHTFIFAILAVLLVGWLTALGPALFTLGLLLVSTAYFFVEPRGTLLIEGLSNQLGLALFFTGGVFCAFVASSERRARRRLSHALQEAIDRRNALEREIGLRQTAQSERAEALARYQTLAEAMPQLVWAADASGKVNYFNQRWLEYTGFRVQDLAQDDAARLIHPDDAEQLNTSWQNAVETQAEQYSCEFRLRHHDGLYFWHLSSARIIRAAEGIVGWVGALTNIHDQKARADLLEREVSQRTQDLQQQVEERTRAEMLAQTAAVELQRSNRELESFASVASHDLQEPLRKILAFGDRLERDSREQLGETGRDYLDRIRNAAARMRRLIDDLLAYSRITTRARPFTPVDLAQVTREVLSDLEVRIAQSNAVVEVETLPTVDADPSQMRQLLQNLIANALKFTAPDQVPHVRIATEPAPEGWVHLVVRDRGIGFEPRFHDRIFQVFQRLHGRNDYEGTGIGLAICKKIVDRHGGCITAHSQPGQGATFVVALPLEQPRTQETES